MTLRERQRLFGVQKGLLFKSCKHFWGAGLLGSFWGCRGFLDSRRFWGEVLIT